MRDNSASMNFLIFELLVLCPLIPLPCLADKLSQNQKAPVFASSAGGLALPLPKENGPKSTNRLAAQGPPQQDDVQREETETIKEQGNEFIRVVSGSVAYKSPEGLPISIKYTADENGNRASFTIGTPGSGGSSVQPGGGRPSGQVGGGSGGKSGGGKGGSGKGDSYLPPNQKKKEDRSYLPPK